MFTRKKKGEPEAEAQDVEAEEQIEAQPTEDVPKAVAPAEPVKYCNRNSNRK